MAISFGFFLDPACTTPIVSSVLFVQADSAPVPSDKVVYFGSRIVGHWAETIGGEAIIATVSGLAASNVVLAFTAAALDLAVPGAALSIAARVDGGMAGVVPIHVRALDTSHVSGQRPFEIITNTFGEWSL